MLSDGWREKAPVLKFTGAFIVATVAFFLITNAAWFSKVTTPLLEIYTSISSGILNVFGMDTLARGDVLVSNDFSVNVEEGCDAVAPAILYVVSILVFPMKWRFKWIGLMAGLATIFILNIIRILTLFLTGVYAQSLFDLMHVEIWQALFIVFIVVMWLYWLKWATAKSAEYAKS